MYHSFQTFNDLLKILAIILIFIRAFSLILHLHNFLICVLIFFKIHFSLTESKLFICRDRKRGFYLRPLHNLTMTIGSKKGGRGGGGLQGFTDRTIKAKLIFFQVIPLLIFFRILINKHQT